MIPRVLKNLYFWSLLIPAIAFGLLALARVGADDLNLTARLYFFGLLAYVGARYVARAPMLMLEGNVTPEGRNITGWGIFIVSIMLQQVLAWLAIVYSDENGVRPLWLSNSYWSPALVVLAGVGITLVASSVPRFQFPFPPQGGSPNGLGMIASFAVGVLSALALFASQWLPSLFKVIGFFLQGLAHAF